MTRAFVNKFRRDETGFMSIDFIFLFPVIIFVMFLALEAGILATRQVMLDRALAETSRTLKLSGGTPPSQEELVQQVCDIANVFPDCTSSVTVEVAPINTNTWDVGAEYIECYDFDNRDGEDAFVPANEYDGGAGSQLMMLKICATFTPLFPYVGLGAKLRKVNETDYSIASAIAYVNEPR